MLKQRRNSVTALHRLFKSHQAAQHLTRWEFLQHTKTVGCYLSFQAEMPTQAIIKSLWQKNKNVLLPLLHNNGSPTLHFHPYSPGTKLTNNRFGIPEPHYNPQHETPAQSLDLVLMPLLGFDRCGSRMGMGGGFYDRTFEFILHDTVNKKRPFMLGLAMDVQELSELERQPWDVPLDGILTESGIETF